ncbi:MAG: AAA family ATPase, partial [Anaerolineae bacterium]|nr:AAA family ATPase [Anaerolineae bacterium]
MDKQTEPNAAGNGHKANGTATKATHKAIDPIWTIYTLADAYKPRDPIQYVVSGLFALPSLSIVYGPPGCMKTMLLTDMAACIASGSPWLEPLPNLAKRTAKKTLKCPVLWMDFDNGSRVMHERLEAAGRVRNMPEDAPLYYASMPDPWLDMGNPVSAKILEHHARSLGAKAIIVDNLGNVSGKADENSADMGKVMSHFRRLAEETGAAVIVVHHQRKSNGTSGRAGETLRGHSSIEAAIDLALLIERENQADQLKIKSTKTRGVDVSPFGAMFTFTHKLPTTELKTMRFFGFEVEDLSSDKAIRRAILEAVKEQPEVNQGDL